MKPDEIAAVAQVAAAIATGILALLTYRYVRATRAMVDEMRAAREAAAAPFVIAYVDVHRKLGWSPADVWFVVENAGRAPALDVVVRADRAIGWHQNFSDDRLTLFDLEFLPAGARRERFAIAIPPDPNLRYESVPVVCEWSLAPGGARRSARSVLEPGPQIAAVFRTQTGYSPLPYQSSRPGTSDARPE